MTDTTNDTDTTLDESGDAAKLVKALRVERAARKEANELLKAAKTELATATAKLTQQSTLDNANAGKVAEHIAASAKALTAKATAEQQTRIAELEAALGESKKQGETLLGQLASRTIADEVRQAALEGHVRPDAVPDLLTFAAADLKLVDGEVRTPDGATVAEWLDARKGTSPYLWPTARGAGARGSIGDGAPAFSGDNPFKPGAGFNLTRQGEILRSNPVQAEHLQQLAQVP